MWIFHWEKVDAKKKKAKENMDLRNVLLSFVVQIKRNLKYDDEWFPSSIQQIPRNQLKSVNFSRLQSVPKKETNTGGAAVGGGDEENGGYESCPDMTPEQLAKIANESPAK